MNPILMPALRRRAMIAVAASVAVIPAGSDSLSSGGNTFGDKSPFDSYCYKRVGNVPIRDPIIGPIKAALRPATGQIVLVGSTKSGVVIVTLPNTFTTAC